MKDIFLKGKIFLILERRDSQEKCKITKRNLEKHSSNAEKRLRIDLLNLYNFP
jgi:hypothetical protein